MNSSITAFLNLVQTAEEQGEFVKLTLGNKRDKAADLKNVFVKSVVLKAGKKLSFVYRYKDRDTTRNTDVPEGMGLIGELLETSFYNADLFTLKQDFHFLQDGSGKSKTTKKPPTHSNIELQHDRQKQRMIPGEGNAYFEALGITTAEGKVRKEMQDKFRQINHYVEIIDGIIKDMPLPSNLSVADMGSGKGYLTFALYDYLLNKKGLQPKVTGIEMREDLVTKCNAIAAAAGFDGLQFIKGSIARAELTATDILIALHACDTATDDAIYKGIRAESRVIICAPCCHKEIRKQMKPQNALSMITKHGILLERQAESVTDSLRALLLESEGYKTSVFEFIGTEHTPKNVMIVGIRNERVTADRDKVLEKVKALKEMFNIQHQHLEKLLHPGHQ